MHVSEQDARQKETYPLARALWHIIQLAHFKKKGWTTHLPLLLLKYLLWLSMGFSSSNDSVTSAQWAALSPDARRLLNKMSPEDRLVLLGAESSSPKKPAATVSPKGKEGRRGLFRHFSSDAVPASRRTSTNSKSIEFVMECPIESSNCNPDETEHSGGDDNEDPVVKPVSTTPRRKVRRHVSADGIPLYIGAIVDDFVTFAFFVPANTYYHPFVFRQTDSLDVQTCTLFTTFGYEPISGASTLSCREPTYLL